MGDEKTYEGWAIVELMGHRRLGGYVTEAEIAGAAMLRLDIPENEIVDVPDVLLGTPPADVYATQFYSGAALYCLTPVTETMARAIRSRPRPVEQWELPRPALQPANGDTSAIDDLFDEHEAGIQDDDPDFPL